MPKIQYVYPRTSTWGSFIDKLVKYFGLPNGSRFALHRKGKANGARPFVRADFEVRRKFFRRDEHPRHGDVRVAEMCRRIENMLAPNNRMRVVGVKPNGEPLDGNTKLKKWRLLPGRITEAERDAAAIRRMVVENLCRLAAFNLAEIEEAIEDPHSEVTEGVISALVNRYGQPAVRDSIQRLRL